MNLSGSTKFLHNIAANRSIGCCSKRGRVMGIERRRTAAQSLRQFFEHHWSYLNALLERRSGESEAARQRERFEQDAVEVVVDGTNSRLRLASGYKKRLRMGVRGLLVHVDRLVAELPGPIDVGADRFLQDPRVNAFLVNRDAIQDIFSQSHEVQSFFSDPLFNSSSHAFAVMLMRKVEKKVLGSAIVDGVLCQDARKTTVSFTGHRILQPRESEAQARDALERLLLARYVEHVNGCLARLGVGDAGASDRRAGWIPSAAGELPNLKDPEVYLHYLSRALDSHRELLRVETSTIRVNRVGEMVAADSNQPANDLDLHEICLGDHAQEVLTLVRYPRAEMLSRDELLQRAAANLQY